MQIFIASVAHSTFWHRHHIYPIRSDASQTPRFDRLIKVICYLHVLQLTVFVRRRSKIGSSIRLMLSLRFLWATITHVLSFVISISDLLISLSVIESSIAVASSRKIALEPFKITLAIATRCLSPPDSASPRSPTTESRPSSKSRY